MKSTSGKETVFINEDGNTVRLPTDFYYDKYSFENYSYQDDCIYVRISSDTKLSLHVKLIKSHKPELLITMLSLREKLSPHLFSSPSNLLFGTKEISEQDVIEIVKWCKTNGYPFDISKEIKAHSKTSKSLLGIPSPATQISFAISKFIFQLNELYCYFFIYQYLMGFIDQMPNDLYVEGQDTNKTGIYKFVKLTDLSIGACKQLFECKYQDIVFQNTISFSNGTHFDTKTHNLFDAAFYQLALLLSVNAEEVKICPLCNKYFIAEHARQKYCNPRECYPQKAYKRKKLQEKKKERLNQQGLTTPDNK